MTHKGAREVSIFNLILVNPLYVINTNTNTGFVKSQVLKVNLYFAILFALLSGTQDSTLKLLLHLGA